MSESRPRILEFEVPARWNSEWGFPTNALVFEVDIEPSDTEISIAFSKGKKYSNLTQQDFAELRQKLGDGFFPIQYKNKPRPQGEFKSPLSVRNDKLTYIVYVLSRKNWQFAKKGSPLTISAAAKAKGAYFDAKRILPGGDTDYGEAEKVGCRAAYLIANGPKAGENSEGEYVDDLNLHVDLRFYDGATPLYMPVIIDPDIRYPGGTAP